MPTITQRSAQVATPKSRAELDALLARREEIRGQLRNAENRRAELAVQSGITPAEQRGAVTQRIASVDEQIQRLESQLARLDEAIANGTANAEIAREEGGGGAGVRGGQGIAVPPMPPVPALPGDHETVIHVPPPYASPGIHPEVVIVGVLGTLGMMALVALVTWKRAKARFSRSGAAVAGGGDVTQLQQSVDAIALEVERISESQRFLTKVLSERGAVKELAGREDTERRSP